MIDAHIDCSILDTDETIVLGSGLIDVAHVTVGRVAALTLSYQYSEFQYACVHTVKKSNIEKKELIS